MKTKTCKHCGKEFKPFRTTQKACSYTCAIELTKPKQLTKKDILSRSDLVKILQRHVNALVREIDKDYPCIACGNKREKYHAGHYYHAGGHAWMRFNFLNIWSECHECNVHLSGNLAHYQRNLVRMGVFDRLETELQTTRNVKLSKDDLLLMLEKIKLAKKEMRKIYGNKLSESERIGVRLWLNERLFS